MVYGPFTRVLVVIEVKRFELGALVPVKLPELVGGITFSKVTVIVLAPTKEAKEVIVNVFPLAVQVIGLELLRLMRFSTVHEFIVGSQSLSITISILPFEGIPFVVVKVKVSF
jgi:hypothetical protein